MKDPYSILGVSESASDEEIKNAYRTLARKYHPDNYKDDNPLKDLANEKMKEVNAAYDEIQKMRSGAGNYRGQNTYYNTQGSADPVYVRIRQMINSHRFTEAERALDAVAAEDRTAEWHYLESLVLMRRRLVNDAMRELEIACNMDPSNMEYQKAKEMFNTQSRGYGSAYYNTGAPAAGASNRDLCDCCANLICLDCLCECMGGDLIPCC